MYDMNYISVSAFSGSPVPLLVTTYSFLLAEDRKERIAQDYDQFTILRVKREAHKKLYTFSILRF